ncbi:MAG: cation:proton antiporter [Hyphomicrobiaceae bacterium]
MTLLDIIALLIGLSAVGGYLNHHVLKLPHTIGLVVVALAASGGVLAIDHLNPSLEIAKEVTGALREVDFQKALMEGMLSALLFAGAAHVDLTELAERKWAIGLMATIGVLLSTFIVGGAIWAVASGLGFNLPFIWALVFGALISPTDPVAVLGILKTVKIPRLLQAKIAGESLLNDGVGVVIFSILVVIATGAGGHGGEMTVAAIAQLFVWEAFGGAALGLIGGLIAYGMMRTLEERYIEVMITIALVTGVYALALKLHVSGPIAVVVAGLLIGNQGARFAMGEDTRRHVFQFWELTDEILNSVLFLLIGLEVLVIAFSPEHTSLALLAIPIVLVARLIAVAIPIGFLRLRTEFTSGAVRILTWAGLRGGISVALALSLPSGEFKPIILTMTYAVVVFSIVVQGLTVERLVRAVVRDAAEISPHSMAATTDEISAASEATMSEDDSGNLLDSGGKRAKRRRRGKH